MSQKPTVFEKVWVTARHPALPVRRYRERAESARSEPAGECANSKKEAPDRLNRGKAGCLREGQSTYRLLPRRRHNNLRTRPPASRRRSAGLLDGNHRRRVSEKRRYGKAAYAAGAPVPVLCRPSIGHWPGSPADRRLSGTRAGLPPLMNIIALAAEPGLRPYRRFGDARTRRACAKQTLTVDAGSRKAGAVAKTRSRRMKA